MYNEEQKIEFIKEYTTSAGNSHRCERIFNSIEPYEIEWDADFCTRTAEELTPVIDSIIGIRSRSKWSTLVILKAYIRWCLANRIDGCRDDLLHIDSFGLENMRNRMVSTPQMMQKRLDMICDPVSKETVDIVFRSYYWLAFSGMSTQEILDLTAENLCFEDMSVYYNGNVYPIYRESVETLKKCANLSYFVFQHPRYEKKLSRYPSDKLMRGIKGVYNENTIRIALSRLTQRRAEVDKNAPKMSHYRIFLSGIFYRKYQLEISGEEVDFLPEAKKYANDWQEKKGRSYKLESGKNLIGAKYRQVAKDYYDDYQQWKLAFRLS